jgi:hypothetical protein
MFLIPTQKVESFRDDDIKPVVAGILEQALVSEA